MRSSEIAYWTTTALFSAVMLFSGVSHFSHSPMMVEAMAAMGYPTYFMTIIGAFKVLGVAAILAPRRPLLKEWAYAGCAFLLVGAALSHMWSGEAFGHWVRPLGVLAVGAASYALRPAARRIADAPALGLPEIGGRSDVGEKPA